MNDSNRSYYLLQFADTQLIGHLLIRYAILGKGINIETEGTVSFSAIPYTDEDLMNARHFWDMQARPYTVLHLDAWTRGVGNASCGHDVDTLPEYRVPNKKMTYKLRISKL